MVTAPTLNLVRESKICDLMTCDQPTERWEASGVLVKDGHYFVVFDDRTEIGRFSGDLQPNDANGLFGLPPPDSEGAQRGEQQLPDPDREIRESLKGPLPTTPDELLAECESLRLRLADGYFTIYVVSSGRQIAHRLWAAMRLIGGVVPPFPTLAEC